jgi:hypothetical protein
MIEPPIKLAGMTGEANVLVAQPDPNDIKNGADGRMLASASGVPQASFTLTQDEVKLIRDFIKVPPSLPGAAQNIKVGDLVPNIALVPLPEPIMKKHRSYWEQDSQLIATVPLLS